MRAGTSAIFSNVFWRILFVRFSRFFKAILKLSVKRVGVSILSAFRSVKKDSIRFSDSFSRWLSGWERLPTVDVHLRKIA